MRRTIDVFKLYFKTYPRIVIIVGICSLLWAITWPASPYLLGVLVDAIQQTDLNLIKTQNQSFITWVDATFWQLGWIIIALIGINLLRNCIYFTIGICFTRSVPPSKISLIKHLYHYLMNQSYRYIENQYSGQLANKIHNAQDGIDKAIQLLNLNLATILALLCSGGLLALVSPFFTIVFWLWAICICIYSYQRALKGKQLSSQYAEKASSLQGHMVDSLSNITTIITQ